MIRVGTCSWNYPSWAGLVYPSLPRGAQLIDYLGAYDTRYSTVEIDRWFWAQPDPEAAREYTRAVPPGFRFTVKAFNGITWGTRRSGGTRSPNPDFLSRAVVAEFLDRLGELRDKLGVLLFQFDYLNTAAMPDPVAFLERLEAFLADLPPLPAVAVETRNPNLLTARYFKMLGRRGAGHVFLQGYWMPPVTRIFERARDYLVGTQVIRLHGEDREGMEERTRGVWDRVVEPRDEELDAVARMAVDLGRRVPDLYLNVNNHYEGSAPLTIRKLEALGVRDEGMDAPP